MQTRWDLLRKFNEIASTIDEDDIVEDLHLRPFSLDGIIEE